MKCKRIFRLFGLTVLSVLMFSCSKEENPVTPPPESNILLNSSFEKNGLPDDDGWTISVRPLGEITNQAPPNGGTFCLKLEASNPGGMATKTIPVMMDKQVYKFSFWAKTNEPSSVSSFELIRNGQVENHTELSITDTLWTEYSIVDTFQVVNNDSLRITFQERFTPLLMLESYFDLVKVEAIN